METTGWLYNCGQVVVGRGPLVVALFLAGLGGSVTHCLTMCSTFVLGQTGSMAGKSALARMLLPYHAGRITTYAVLGVIAAFGLHFLTGWSGFGVLRRLMLAIVATLFIATLAGRLLQRAGLHLPFGLAFKPVCALRDVTRIGAAGSGLARYGLGLSLGLLPCPLVLAALMAVAAEANPALAAVAMAAFGVGTMPVLVGLGFAGGNILNKNPRLQDGLTLAALGINGVILMALAVG